MERKLYGKHIVSDSEICHWKPTFRGTRILVADVLEQVAEGLAWEAIIEEWRGKLTKEAIAEAMTKAKRMGCVVHASHIGLAVWRLRAKKQLRYDWKD